MKAIFFTNRKANVVLLLVITLTPMLMYPMLSRSIKLKSFPSKSRLIRQNCSYHMGIGAAIAESHVLKNMLLVKTPNPCPTIKLIHSLFYQPEPTTVEPIMDKSAVTRALTLEIVEQITQASQANTLKEQLPYIADKWQIEYTAISEEQTDSSTAKIEDLLSSINAAHMVDKELLHSILRGFLWKSKQIEQISSEKLSQFHHEIQAIKDPYGRVCYAKNNLSLAINTIIAEKKSSQDLMQNLLDPKILSHEYSDPASRALFYVHANPCIDRSLLKKAFDNNWKSSAIAPSIYYALPVNDDYQKINVICDILFFNTDKQAIDYAYALFKSLSQDNHLILMPNILKSDAFLNTLQKDESFSCYFNNFVIHNAEQIMETIKEADGNPVDMITKLGQGMHTNELKDKFFKTYKPFLLNQQNILKMQHARE